MEQGAFCCCRLDWWPRPDSLRTAASSVSISKHCSNRHTALDCSLDMQSTFIFCRLKIILLSFPMIMLLKECYFSVDWQLNKLSSSTLNLLLSLYLTSLRDDPETEMLLPPVGLNLKGLFQCGWFYDWWWYTEEKLFSKPSKKKTCLRNFQAGLWICSYTNIMEGWTSEHATVLMP